MALFTVFISFNKVYVCLCIFTLFMLATYWPNHFKHIALICGIQKFPNPDWQSP